MKQTWWPIPILHQVPKMCREKILSLSCQEFLSQCVLTFHWYENETAILDWRNLSRSSRLEHILRALSDVTVMLHCLCSGPATNHTVHTLLPLSLGSYFLPSRCRRSRFRSRFRRSRSPASSSCSQSPLPSRVIRGVGGWFKRPKNCFTPSENESSENRLKIWQIPIQT